MAERSLAARGPRVQGDRPDRGDCRDRGSVLMLMPAGVLVVLVLGALAVDLSVVHLGQREAAAAAGAAVNDAVTWGVDDATLYTSGDYAVDPARATEAVEATLAAQEYSGRHVRLVGPPLLTDATGDGNLDTVTVTVSMWVDYVFAGVIPGANSGTTVSATATATAHSN